MSVGLIDIHRTFHSKSGKYTFSSIRHKIFSRIDCMLGHKISLNKFKRKEIILSIFFNDNAMKVEIYHRKKSGETTSMWKLNNMLIKNQRVKGEIKEEIRK